MVVMCFVPSGTPVEAWSSPAALAKCPHDAPPNDEPSPDNDSVLWNSMIVPFLRTTLKGAIWYQGEADASYPLSVECLLLFPLFNLPLSNRQPY